ncbi:hypothetical protein ACFSWE_04940 [Leucobacter albus]|uniref:SUKH-3 immunity protein of toxin-antitoxin system n=1 Tax=Leucobacter albus TaxID=272210 RepID=A0ABW3TKM5_9MICO
MQHRDELTPQEAAISALRAAGWRWVPRGAHEPVAPADGGVDEPSSEPCWQQNVALTAWQRSYDELASEDESVWFLAVADYGEHGAGSDAFAWNAFERLSLEGAVDADERAAVTRFWARHHPIMLSVRGAYSYLALRDDGAVVFGEEPEFEATTTVAGSVEQLLESIAYWGSVITPEASQSASPASAASPASPGIAGPDSLRELMRLLFGEGARP